jgi:hypothetical protein
MQVDWPARLLAYKEGRPVYLGEACQALQQQMDGAGASKEGGLEAQAAADANAAMQSGKLSKLKKPKKGQLEQKELAKSGPLIFNGLRLRMGINTG